MSSVIALRATGSADSDTANIKSAITQLTNDRLLIDPGTIILSPGHYRINDTLLFGEHYATTGNDVNPPRFGGAGLAYLTWYGSETNKPMIKYQYPWAGCGTYLFNLRLTCRHPDTLERCRGIEVQHAIYGHELRDIMVQLARQVGIDLVNCWGSVARNIVVSYTKGISMRLHQFNSCVLDTIKLKHGSGEDFPPVDDDTVLEGVYDTYLQTAESERGGLLINTGNCLVANNIMPEGNDYTTTPEIVFNNYRQAQMNSIRFEGSSVTEDLIKTVGNCDNININDVLYRGNAAKSLIRATSADRGIRVDGGRCKTIDGCVICDGGHHAGHQVMRIDNRDITMDKWIVEENSPTMSGKICADSDHSVSIPWQ